MLDTLTPLERQTLHTACTSHHTHHTRLNPPEQAPEVFKHVAYDGRADLWSVGAVLFEMVCGRPPFTGTSAFDLFRNIEVRECVCVCLLCDCRV